MADATMENNLAVVPDAAAVADHSLPNRMAGEFDEIMSTPLPCDSRGSSPDSVQLRLVADVLCNAPSESSSVIDVDKLIAESFSRDNQENVESSDNTATSNDTSEQFMNLLSVDATDQGKQVDEVGKHSKRKHRRGKGTEHILQALSSLQTSDEKLAALCAKYSELYESNRIVQLCFIKQQKVIDQLKAEHDSAVKERDKAKLLITRLENLCRELEKRNRNTLADAGQKLKLEEQKRLDATKHFQSLIAEVEKKMAALNEYNDAVTKKNVELEERLVSITELSKRRDVDFAALNDAKKEERELINEKLNSLNMQLLEEQKASLQERSKYLQMICDRTQRVQQLEASEKSLQEDLDCYRSKYSEFEKHLTQSNRMFGDFKKDFERVKAKLAQVDKERQTWKENFESAKETLLRYDETAGKQRQRIDRLEQLCRTMQEERRVLLQQMKDSSAAGSGGGAEAKSERAAQEASRTTPDSDQSAAGGATGNADALASVAPAASCAAASGAADHLPCELPSDQSASSFQATTSQPS